MRSYHTCNNMNMRIGCDGEADLMVSKGSKVLVVCSISLNLESVIVYITICHWLILAYSYFHWLNSEASHLGMVKLVVVMVHFSK